MVEDKEKDTVEAWLRPTGPRYYLNQCPARSRGRGEQRQTPLWGRAPGKSQQRTAARNWQLDRTKDVLRAEFPDGVPPNLTDKEVRRRIEPVFKKNGWKLSSVDTIARARGRRDRRG